MCELVFSLDKSLAFKPQEAQRKDPDISALEYCESLLERAESGNAYTNAFSKLFHTTAMSEAKCLDQMTSRELMKAKLAGVPIAVKDNIDSLPGPCCAGLGSFSNYHPNKDAKIVEKLRTAGAIIVGAARTDAGAFGVTTPEVTNPKFPDRIVGGSSGGPAAAVAAGLCTAAIGTDTGGSIRIPAACCGVYGFKPTYGRVSLAGVRPLAPSYDHVGPIAQCVADLVEVMHVIDPDFTETSRPLASGPLVLGVPSNCFSDASPEVQANFEDFISKMRDRGCEVRDIFLPPPDEVLPMHFALSLHEAALQYEHLSADDISRLPRPAIEGINYGRSISNAQVQAAKERKRDLIHHFDKAAETVDAIVMPTLPVLVPERNEQQLLIGSCPTDTLMDLVRYTATFDQTGQPALAVPWAADGAKLPFSIQLIGARNQDLKLLEIAAELEL